MRMEQQRIPSYILTAGLVVVFAYFGLDKFIHHLSWVGWIPSIMEGFLGLSRDSWILFVGFMEMTTAVLLLVPKRTVRLFGAALASVQMVAVLSQTGWNTVAARDLCVLASALALFFLVRSE